MGLYPGDEITPEGTPDLAKAARKTLEVRGDDGLGWSYAYRAVLWARLGDGNHAWLIVKRALSPVATHEIRYDNGGWGYFKLVRPFPPVATDSDFCVAVAPAEKRALRQNTGIPLVPARADASKGV